MLTFSVNKAPLPHNHSNQISFTEFKVFNVLFCYYINRTCSLYVLLSYFIKMKNNSLYCISKYAFS